MIENELKIRREKINKLDREIVGLLKRRAALAEEIGDLKREEGLPVLDMARERELISRLTDQADGPLTAGAIRHVFGEIISACRALQGPVPISFLGPEATFSHIAAKEHFGRSAHFLPQESIGDVFREVECGRAQYGVVPIENSTEGGVGATMDRFIGSPLRVCGEINLRVRHAVMSKEQDLSRVERVLSHPQALGQCLEWLSKNLPAAKMAATSSTSAAAARAAVEPRTAALGSEMLAELHGLQILARGVQDRSLNLTRFLVIGHEDCPATGRDKTSIWFAVPHRPGSLHKILEPLAELGVNMTRIESRPAGEGPWEYLFFLDIEGHKNDKAIRAALEGMARAVDKIKILGSYPQAEADGLEASGAAPWNLNL